MKRLWGADGEWDVVDTLMQRCNHIPRRHC